MADPVQVYDGDGVSPIDRQLIEKLRELPAHMGTDMLLGGMQFNTFQIPVIKKPLPSMPITDIVNTTPSMMFDSP